MLRLGPYLLPQRLITSCELQRRDVGADVCARVQNSVLRRRFERTEDAERFLEHFRQSMSPRG